ncbi:MAG: hypothetical protein DRI57_08790 [Deltaproteobacteria bacterium]|nr:MAG: hypothetical protein DRI57_08790 [Deltaproteobacteria bacterium]
MIRIWAGSEPPQHLIQKVFGEPDDVSVRKNPEIWKYEQDITRQSLAIRIPRRSLGTSKDFNEEITQC